MNKETAKYYIDVAAGEARSKYISTGPRQEAIYMIKSLQARKFKDSGYVGTVPPLVNAEVQATGLPAQQVTDMIISTEDAWIVLAAEIERIRRSAKIAIDQLTDLNEISTYCQNTINTLKNL